MNTDMTNLYRLRGMMEEQEEKAKQENGKREA